MYTAILQAQPKHPDANHNLGVLTVGVGKFKEALPVLKTALEANSSIAQFWLSYVDTLIRLDRIAEAKAVLDIAKRKGANGDGFDKLEMRITEAAQVPLYANQIAVISQNKHHNTLDSLKVEKAIKFTNNKERSGAPKEAERKNKGDLSKLPEKTIATDGPKGQTNNSTDRIS